MSVDKLNQEREILEGPVHRQKTTWVTDENREIEDSSFPGMRALTSYTIPGGCLEITHIQATLNGSIRLKLFIYLFDYID